MDPFLIEYLRSGEAWVLVGSGPSIEMGYPSWEKLAQHIVEVIKREAPSGTTKNLVSSLQTKDYPKVFEEAKTILGGSRQLYELLQILSPQNNGEIYNHIARWPVSVFMTTNYDDEIQRSLARVGETYTTYSNSEDHMAHLTTGLRGAIFKLHGDLRSENGLVLTSSQYQEITKSAHWTYWRTKMTSVFQMQRIVVIGHSLNDPNIRHVLAAAKQGSGVVQPICWIAPDVPFHVAKEFLHLHRIRVISYDNREGHHKNLTRLIENVSEFIYPRKAIPVVESIRKVSQSPLGNNASAPGFFVFNKIAALTDFENKRADVLLAAMESVIATLKVTQPFTWESAIYTAGWPKDFPMDSEFSAQLQEKAIERGILTPARPKTFQVGSNAEASVAQKKLSFEHVRDRFKASIQLRIKRGYPALTDADVAVIANDIDASLTGYFKEGGLSLASMVFSSTTAMQSSHGQVPSSIIKFISEASARYDDMLKRQAFCTVSVDTFIHAGTAEHDYLGRISQGFFAFHALGVYGDVANERLSHAKETVWLIDSHMQIPLIALGAPTNSLMVDSIRRMRECGLRVFTTESLFDETCQHLTFASDVIKYNGPASDMVSFAAMGQAPFRKSNQFLEGFIRWQTTGNPCDWNSYLFHAFGNRNPSKTDVKNVLHRRGIEVVTFEDWPGFTDSDFAARDEYMDAIATLRESVDVIPDGKESELSHSHQKKAEPEAEALIIVIAEREGKYYILSKQGTISPCWFISHTSILNTVAGRRITWHPNMFLKFVSTLCPPQSSQAADQAFEALLWGIAESGISLLDEESVSRVLGGIIDQAVLNISEQRQLYHDTLESKYGLPLESLLERVRPCNKPLAALQLANEIAQANSSKAKLHAEKAKEAEKRARTAEKTLEDVEHFRRKMEAKQERGKQKAHKQQANTKKKK